MKLNGGCPLTPEEQEKRTQDMVVKRAKEITRARRLKERAAREAKRCGECGAMKFFLAAKRVKGKS